MTIVASQISLVLERRTIDIVFTRIRISRVYKIRMYMMASQTDVILVRVSNPVNNSESY